TQALDKLLDVSRPAPSADIDQRLRLHIEVVMKSVHRLEWRRCPQSYRFEQRPMRVGPPFDPGYRMLLPRSPQLEDYAHDFNKTRLVVLELWNAVSDGGDAALLDLAKEWGLPDHHHEARCEDLLETAFPTADLVHPGKRKPYLPLRAIPVVADDG